MTLRHSVLSAALVALGFISLAPRDASAQSATLEGRIVDQQRAAVPGATVTALDPRTGFTRVAVSDSEGLYRLAGLPVGTYDLTASLDGFATVERANTIIDVSSIVRTDFELRVAQVRETVNVTAGSPLVQTASPVVSGVVDQRRIAELPLNGRQFANLAATLPGVGIAFHLDPTKGTQYTPQVGGGNGRNVAYVVDGATNNDDTVGGLLQLFPLDAIDQFRFSTASFSAETGGASGGVMHVVTKSGTNVLAGSAFSFFRDDTLNARTTTEANASVPKSDYRRWQFGGSAGGPIARDTAHFFGAVEPIRQNAFQAVDPQGVFPALDGVFPIEYREYLFTGKLTWNAGPRDRMALRYSRNTSRQPQGAGPRVPPVAWGDNRNAFNAVNANYSRVLGNAMVNELVVQYATYDNAITSNTTQATETFPNGVVVGVGLNLPQATEQRTWQARDDMSWHVTRKGGLGHEMKSGISFAYEPRLGSPAGTQQAGFFAYTHATNDPRGPLTAIGGNSGSTPIEYPALQIPMKQFGVYLQDDWRVTPRLTVNAGVRYDLIVGYQIDQSRNPNFTVLQTAARAGRFAGIVGFEDLGQAARNDTNNVQPRLGFALDLRGTGQDVIRGGWGVYTNTEYTNANVLFAASDALGPLPASGFSASNPNGIRKPDGTFFRVGDPVASIAGLNEAGPGALNGEVVSPLLQLPYTLQTSVGWSHQIGAVTALTVDVVHADGRDLSARPRLNQRPNGGPRRFADLPLSPNTAAFKVVVSEATSRYDALILGVRRRTAIGTDLAASYTLSSAKSDFGKATDETGLTANLVIDVMDPFGPVEFGPSAADARHRLAFSAIVPLKWGMQVAPILSYRSALPVNVTEGVDRNNDFNNNDLADRAVAFSGLGQPPRDIGPCVTVNCGRGAPLSQFNLRASKRFTLPRGGRFEAIVEVFNAFNASNPSGFNGRRLLGTPPNLTANPNFMQPTTFAGDFQQPEQRVGQIGFRWTF